MESLLENMNIFLRREQEQIHQSRTGQKTMRAEQSKEYEIARLKGHNQRAKIPPSQLDGSKRRKTKRRGKKRPGSKKRQ
jgi:hypothetical protein